MSGYRLTKKEVIDILSGWNRYLKRKVRLIACGGTALTLINIKESTKDVDFMVPEQKDYKYLISIMKKLGYKNTRGYGWKKEGEVYF